MIRYYVTEKVTRNEGGIEGFIVRGSPFDDMEFGPQGSCYNYGLLDKGKLFCRVKAVKKVHDNIIKAHLGDPISPALEDEEAEKLFLDSPVGNLDAPLLSTISAEAKTAVVSVESVRTTLKDKLRDSI